MPLLLLLLHQQEQSIDHDDSCRTSSVLSSVRFISKISRTDASHEMWWRWRLKGDGGGDVVARDMVRQKLAIIFEKARVNMQGFRHARSPLEAKMEALLFLFLKIKENSQLSRIYTICTASKLLEEIFIKGSDGYGEEEMLEFNSDWEELVKDKKFKVQFIFGEYLSGADRLAKDGGLRNKMLHA
ncbi:hypothetical protein ACET3Z_011718 [Daucus carota]